MKVYLDTSVINIYLFGQYSKSRGGRWFRDQLKERDSEKHAMTERITISARRNEKRVAGSKE